MRDTKGIGILRSHHTMTRSSPLRRMGRMRTVVILATLSFGALRVMWRALSQSDPPGYRIEWTADE